MANVCKFYKQKRQVSYDCETWQDVTPPEYKQGDLYEKYSSDCGFALMYRWALLPGYYECDGVRKYNVEVLQYSVDGIEYEKVEPEYKRKSGSVVDYLSDDCGYVESTGAFKFSGSSVIECGSHYMDNSEQLLVGEEVAGKVAAHSIIGDCTEVVGPNAFANSILEDIEISDYVKKMGYGVFAGCSGLTYVRIPDSVDTFDVNYISDSSLFRGCSNLTGVTLPSGLDYIPSDFFAVTAISNYVLPNGIRLIGAGSFEGLSGLKITFNENLTDIGPNAFYGSTFQGGLTLPSSVKALFEWGNHFTFDGDFVLPNGLEHINGFLSEMSQEHISKEYGDIEIPASVKKFDGSTSKASYIYNEGIEWTSTPSKNDLPNSVLFTTISAGFKPYACSFLVPTRHSVNGEVTIPENVVVCPGSAPGMFPYRPVIIFESHIPPIDVEITNDRYISYIFVPDDSLELYKLMWRDMADRIYPLSWKKYEWRQIDISQGYECVGVDKHYIEHKFVSFDNGNVWYDTCLSRVGELYEEDSLDCGYIPTVYTLALTYNDGKSNKYITCDTTHIPSFSGDGTIETISIGECARTMDSQCFSACTSVTSLTIDNGLTEISESAFYNCSGLTNVVIPDSVTSIGQSAFQYCSGLTSCTIGSGVTTIGGSAFDSCSFLTNVTIPNSVTYIGSNAFYDTLWWNTYSADTSHQYNNVIYINDIAYKATSSSITSVTFKSGTVSIGGDAFNYCTGLTSVTIPDSVTSIGDSAFYRCNGLTSVAIGNGVTSIGYQAFWWCRNLASVSIGSGVTSIGDSVFSRCYALTSITIPDSVTSIGGAAFNNCTGLTSITVEAVTPPTLGDSAFANTNCPIYVTNVDTYKAASGWSTYASRIQPIP